ncbi:MAG TPA: HTH domain-containing protein [bacterium]|nr:HTH domain-containing protein [bacterium]
MEERILTNHEELAYRYCHQDFKGLTTAKAAEKMGVTQRRVQQLLRSAVQKCPQLLPILTKRQTEIRLLINDDGFTSEQIAQLLNISIHTVGSTVSVLKTKGIYLEKRKPTLSYQKWMDNQITEKF